MYTQHSCSGIPSGARQRGLVLPVALLLLIIVTLAGVAAARVNVFEERMAGAARDRNQALQAAEAGLRAGERLLATGGLVFDGTGGLYQAPAPDQPLVWGSWTATNWASNGRAYDATLTSVAGQPRYIIEELVTVAGAGGGSIGSGAPVSGAVTFYRITARAVGATDKSLVILQSTYRRG